MEKTFQARKGYYMPEGLFEYLLIVSPGGDVYNRVMEEKQYFSEKYQQPVAIKTKPHITILNFMAWDNVEGSLIAGLQRIAKGQQSFMVTLNNYSGFPPDTVFIRIQDHAPFKKLDAGLSAIVPFIKTQASTL